MEFHLLPLPPLEIRPEKRWGDPWYQAAVEESFGDSTDVTPRVQDRIQEIEMVVENTLNLAFHLGHMPAPPGLVYLFACCIQRDYYVRALCGEEDVSITEETEKALEQDRELVTTDFGDGKPTWENLARIDTAIKRHRELFERL
jgi:hypothetical protein